MTALRHLATPRLPLLGLLLLICNLTLAAAPGEKLPIGEFVAAPAATPPVMDGILGEEEWAGALISSGMITPFDLSLQETQTTVGMTWDSERLYFFFDSVRGDREWKLWKSVRENDGYSFGDPSIEIWITPPALVPETYQSIINTYPAVMDNKQIPTRGYTAAGWRGNWEMGVSESETRYIIEASLPVSDLDGFERLSAGELWRFLLCRTSPGTQSRSQASWSLTQAFSELAQHPSVLLVEDSPMLQVRNISSLHSGNYDLGITGVGARGGAGEITLEVRFHQGIAFSDDDRVITRELQLPAGGREQVQITGKLPAEERGHLTIHATRADGTTIFRQSWPYAVSGWTPKTPTKPERAREPQELDLMVRYGPIHNTAIVRADIIDLPSRDQVAGGSVQIIDPANNGKVLLEQPLGEFREWYGSTHFTLDSLRIPVVNYKNVEYVKRQNDNIEQQNAQRQKRGQEPLPLKELPIPEPMQVQVRVTVVDAEGNALRANSTDLDLRRYTFLWENNDIGISDAVIPPWTPLTYDAGTIGVWNRTYELDGLGLLEAIKNDGLAQVQRMRLVAVRDGREIELTGGAPQLQRHVDAEARFSGSGTGAGLRVDAETEVEFDGFVLNTLTIGPADGAAPPTIDKLYWEVVLPEAEATHFCSTAGGWSAIHAATPPYWSSQSTSSGVMIGDFVPYVWLTNSDRAFMWFADSDKGWFTDDDRSHPTQEIRRENGTVTLRVHFVEVPTTFTETTTIEHGWQTFPSRPLPEGWRTIICSQRADALADARNTYFWFDGDWAVLWPYYSSPYAWNFEKSRDLFERFPPNTNHRPMVGSIAHSIGRYRDYAGNTFNEYGVDWGETPGDLSNANVTQNKGSTDFRLYHYRQWVRRSGFRGLYVDENYISFDRNFLSGGAYMRPDGQLQIGYSYLGLREYFKRFRYMMHEEGMPAPNLWQHISSGAAYNAWFGDAFFEGENVGPTNLEFDYLKVLPEERMRAIGSSRTAGGAMTMMCQANRHATAWKDKHVHQFIGWVMAHDIIPEQLTEWELMAQQAQLYLPTDFLAYWKEETPLKSSDDDIIVSAHRNAARTTIWIVNRAREPRDATISFTAEATAFDGEPVLIDAETGARIERRGNRFTVPILERDYVAVAMLPPSPAGTEGASFLATFESGPRADYAWGADIFTSSGTDPDALPLTAGRHGKALLIAESVAMRPHLNLLDTRGTLSAEVRLSDASRGSIVAFTRSGHREQQGPVSPTLHLEIDKGELVFGLKGRVDNRLQWLDGKSLRVPRPAAGWHDLRIAWANGTVELSIDGESLGTLPMERINVCAGTGKQLLSSGDIVFGDRSRAVTAIDTVTCHR